MLSEQLTIDELLVSEEFRKRPGMYIGGNGISALYFFIAGIHQAIFNYRLDEEFNRDIWLKHSFREWIVNHFDRGSTTAGWMHIILEENAGNEQVALRNFFELYDKFRSEI